MRGIPTDRPTYRQTDISGLREFKLPIPNYNFRVEKGALLEDIPGQSVYTQLSALARHNPGFVQSLNSIVTQNIILAEDSESAALNQLLAVADPAHAAKTAASRLSASAQQRPDKVDRRIGSPPGSGYTKSDPNAKNPQLMNMLYSAFQARISKQAGKVSKAAGLSPEHHSPPPPTTTGSQHISPPPPSSTQAHRVASPQHAPPQTPLSGPPPPPPAADQLPPPTLPPPPPSSQSSCLMSIPPPPPAYTVEAGLQWQQFPPPPTAATAGLLPPPQLQAELNPLNPLQPFIYPQYLPIQSLWPPTFLLPPATAAMPPPQAPPIGLHADAAAVSVSHKRKLSGQGFAEFESKRLCSGT